MCYPDGDFLIGAPTCTSATSTSAWTAGPGARCRKEQFEYWSHTHLTIDVVPGRGAGFSLEAPDGVRFLIRSRLMTDEECPERRL